MAAAPGDDDVDEVAAAYERYGVELVRFAALIAGTDHAEDVVAEAVLSVLRSKRRRPVENWRAYLYRAVLNQAGTQGRKGRRRRSLEERAAGPVSEDPVDVDPAVHTAVERLSDRQRAVVLLTYWQDLTPAQVAELLGIGEGSVRRHLARARAALRKELSP